MVTLSSGAHPGVATQGGIGSEFAGHGIPQGQDILA